MNVLADCWNCLRVFSILCACWALFSPVKVHAQSNLQAVSLDELQSRILEANQLAATPAGARLVPAAPAMLAVLEQVDELHLTLLALKDVILLNLDHRKLSTFFAQCILLPRGFLFLCEQRLAGDQPLGSRHDFWTIHFFLSIG